MHTRQLQQYTKDNHNNAHMTTTIHKTTYNNAHKATTTMHTRQLQQYTQLTITHKTT